MLTVVLPGTSFAHHIVPSKYEDSMPDRSDAVALLEEWVENDGLRKHMYSVEAAVRHYARMRGETF